MATKTIDISDVILVSEVSSSELGLHYEREILSEQLIGEREEKLFKTLRVFENKPEALRAKAVYEQARARLRKLCSKTVLGLVCPAAQETALEEEIGEIERMIAEANRGFSVCKVDYTVVPIRIEHDNARAQEALQREIRRYAERLVDTVKSYDVEAIRKVLKSGKGLETLLADESLRQSFEELNRSARDAAREVVKSIKEHDGDEAAALGSAAVRSAAAEVARRFPWADAFDSAPATSCVMTERAA